MDDVRKSMMDQFDNGKREWSFDEMQEIMEKKAGISKDETLRILKEIAREQKEQNEGQRID